MFEAFAIFCFTNMIVIGEPQCIRFDDTYGPFKTKENCDIRATQLVNDFFNEDLDVLMLDILNDPYYTIDGYGFCQEIKENTKEKQI